MSDPHIVLYGLSVTPFTQKVLRALHIKGLAFDYHEPASAEEIRRWSPETGQLPVIEIAGERIVDSEAILDALDARFPNPPLLSRDPKVAREQRRLSTWVGETFRFYLMRWLTRDGAETTPDTHDAHGHALGPLARMGLIDPQGRLDGDTFDIATRAADPEFERRLEDLDGMLGDRDYFHADALSRADVAVVSSLLTLYTDRFAGGLALLRRFPRLLRFVERVGAETGGTELERPGGGSGR